MRIWVIVQVMQHVSACILELPGIVSYYELFSSQGNYPV